MSSSKKKCVLHIGTHKTGTTSIQRYLRTHEVALAERGVRLSRALVPTHARIVRYALDESKTDGARRQSVGHSSSDDVLRYRERVQKSIAEVHADMGEQDTLVLSDEGLSRLTSGRELERVRELLSDFDVLVLVYLRPQHELLISGYTQQLRGGATSRLELKATQQDLTSLRFRYDLLLALWTRTFPDAKVVPRLFTPGDLLDGDVVKDFCAQVGVSTDGLPQAPRENESLTPLAQEFLRLTNQYMPRYVNKRVNPPRKGFPKLLLKLYSGKGFTGSRQELSTFFHTFDEFNDATRREWFPGRERLFTPDFSRYPETSEAPAMDLDTFVRMFCEVWSAHAEESAPIKAPSAPPPLPLGKEPG